MSLPSELLPVGLLGTGAAGEYTIDRSLRFNSSDSAYLSRTPASAGNRKTWTWSGWVKRSKLGGSENVFSAPTFSGIRFESSTDRLKVFDYVGSFQYNIETSQVFRDVSAWFHLVVAIDTTQATSANRVRLYVNGAEITAFSTASYPSQNYDTLVNAATAHYLGGSNSGGYAEGFNGYLADIHFIDGQALTPSDFTKTDATTGQLIPKAYSGTYGTNGFHLPFSDNSTAAALGTDTSGNGNTWTVNNISVEAPKTLPGISLDGNGDYLSFADSASFDLGQSSEPFTIEAWVKLSSQANGSIFSRGGGAAGWNSTNGHQYLFFYYNNNIYFQWWTGSALVSINGSSLTTNVWTHLAAVFNGSSLKIYKNGIEIISSASPTFGLPTTRNITRCGAHPSGDTNWHGIISNLRIVKGTAVYTGAFTPSTSLTNVTNTVLLCCKSNSSATASVVTPSTITSVGDTFATTFTDSSGADDSLVDTPTNGSQTDTGVGGEVVGNYCTFNPLNNPATSATLANGNLEVTANTTLFQAVTGTIFASTGKWYAEFLMQTTATDQVVGIAANTFVPSTAENRYLGRTADSYGFYSDGRKIYNSTLTSYGTSWSVGDILQVALDLDNGKVWLGKNGTWQASGDPAAGTNAAFTGIFGSYTFACSPYGTGKFFLNAGQRPFAYTAPSGYKALCTTNLPDPVVAQPSTVFDVIRYTGNGSTQTIPNVNTVPTTLGFGPDLVWIKNRIDSAAGDHRLYDTVRGATKELYSNLTVAEGTEVNGLTAFFSDGFSVGSINAINGSSDAIVAWCWDAGSDENPTTYGPIGSGADVEGAQYSITSSVRANTSAGFSIVTYTAQSSGSATVGHGLGVAPSLIITKSRTMNLGWYIYTKTVGSSGWLQFTTAAAVTGNTAAFGGVDPTSTVFTYGSGLVNTGDIVAYCFAPVSGYSSFGSYTGNGSAAGPFVYTGFRPAFILIKGSSFVSNWFIQDNERDGYNVNDGVALRPNLSNAEDGTTTYNLDILSNGFKLRTSAGDANTNSATFVWAAFASHPFKTSRAR